MSALALVAVILACASEGGALSSLSTIPSQVSAAVYVQEWGQILWGMVTSQTGTLPTVFGEPVTNPDGSTSRTSVAADGTTWVETSFLDGTFRLDISLPDGSTQTVLQSAPVYDGVSKTTMEYHVTSSDGLSADYASITDDAGTPMDWLDDIWQLSGSAVLPGGTRQTFEMLSADARTDLQSTQSDGSTFTLSMPLTIPDLQPDFSQQSSGTYTDPRFALSFALASTPRFPTRWAALLSDVGGEVTGTFSLNADFSGFGQLEESGTWGQTLAALASWTHQGEIDAYSLSGQDVHMGPAAAALDCLQHHWQTLAALMAPASGISGFAGRPHGPRVAFRSASRRTLHSLRRQTAPVAPAAQTGGRLSRRVR